MHNDVGVATNRRSEVCVRAYAIAFRRAGNSVSTRIEIVLLVNLFKKLITTGNLLQGRNDDTAKKTQTKTTIN